MKKLLAGILAALVLMAALTGCSGRNESQGQGKTDPSAGASNPNAATSDATEPPDDDDLNWPNGPITLLVGYSAGGASDIAARYLAAALEKQLGVSVIVENETGSGSWVAYNDLLHIRPKDGNTFAQVQTSIAFAQYDETNPRTETLDDWALLCNHVIDASVIAIRNDETRFTTLEELIAYGQDNVITYAPSSVSISSNDVTTAKMLTKDYGCQFLAIPVDGSSEAIAMFKSGEVDIFITKMGDMAGAVENGYHPIVVFSEERSESFPDCPTAKECGVDYISFAARGYAYAAGVDQQIVDKMSEALVNAFYDPDYQASMAAAEQVLSLADSAEYKQIMLDTLDGRLYYWDIER